MKNFERFRAATLCGMLMLAPVANVGADEQLLIHVKTALSVDDAQICAVPNVAWAALSQGKEVTLLFDASAVTSVTKRFGWRGWLGTKTTAMDRAALPERERKSLAEQFQVPDHDRRGPRQSLGRSPPAMSVCSSSRDR